jgi:hypothetical protein
MYHTVNRAPVQAIRPNLPHYHNSDVELGLKVITH